MSEDHAPVIGIKLFLNIVIRKLVTEYHFFQNTNVGWATMQRDTMKENRFGA